MEHGIDRLVVGFDMSNEDDIYMMVIREDKEGQHLVNKFNGNCAEDLYSILVGEKFLKNKKGHSRRG